MGRYSASYWDIVGCTSHYIPSYIMGRYFKLLYEGYVAGNSMGYSGTLFTGLDSKYCGAPKNHWGLKFKDQGNPQH